VRGFSGAPSCQRRHTRFLLTEPGETRPNSPRDSRSRCSRTRLLRGYAKLWAQAGKIERGVLFEIPRRTDQGFRELVALNGLCNAHQRISGDLQAKDTTGREQKSEVVPSSLAKLQAIELARPVAAVFAGTAVTAGGAVGTHSLAVPTLLGLLSAGRGFDAVRIRRADEREGASVSSTRSSSRI